MRRLHVSFLEFFVLISFASLVTMRLPRLRLRSVSLRLVLGLVAIAAVWMGWIVHRVRVQQEGIDLIRLHGGMYYYDFENQGATSGTIPRSWAPGWLVNNLGIDYFHHVTWVRIEDPTFDDNDLGRLTACLPRIESLGIHGTAISDAGLRHLRGNRSLLRYGCQETASRMQGSTTLPRRPYPCWSCSMSVAQTLAPPRLPQSRPYSPCASRRRRRPIQGRESHNTWSSQALPRRHS